MADVLHCHQVYTDSVHSDREANSELGRLIVNITLAVTSTGARAALLLLLLGERTSSIAVGGDR